MYRPLPPKRILNGNTCKYLMLLMSLHLNQKTISSVFTGFITKPTLLLSLHDYLHPCLNVTVHCSGGGIIDLDNSDIGDE